VASDVLGVSGRLMLEALVGGTTDPEVLADLARGALRKQLAVLQEALQGPVARHHRLLVAELLAHLDYLDEAIERLSVEVARVVAPVLAAAGAVVHYPRRGQADRRGDPG
jgi:transposase